MSIPDKYKKNIFYKIFNNTRLLYFRVLSIIEKFFNKILKESNIDKYNQEYQKWIKQNWPKQEELVKQKISQKKFKYRPKISVITPVYNPDEKWLRSCIESVINQTYDNWELCLADDNSTKEHVKKVLEEYSKKDNKIKIIYRSKNGHISQASNSALKISTGEYIALLDHDDDLAPNALYEIVKILNDNPKIDFIYSDEDKIELNGKHVDPFFKPDWSPDMLMSLNYICHLSVIRKKIVDQIRGFRIGFEGSQDYDLFLRVTEITKSIYHIPKILYSWRKVPNSTSTTYSVKNYCNQASINALQDSLKRKKIEGSACTGLVNGSFRTKYKIINNPLVSIIIPTKDKAEYLKRCVNSIEQKTTYNNYEILIIDTGSKDLETSDYYKTLTNNNKIKILNWQGTFNYSTVNNFGVKHAKGKYILLLNNDTEVITPEWIESMLEHAQRKEIGAVGVKLLYPNKKIQHAGVILGIKGGNINRGVAGHIQKMFKDIPMKSPILNSKDIIRNFSAVTAACLMISKEKYLEVNGLDEKFRIAFNDVDFNLKLRQKGYFNLYTPYTKLCHYESISVGTPQKGNRNIEEFQNEINMMIEKWDNLLENDPFYNKNLDLKYENFDIKI